MRYIRFAPAFITTILLLPFAIAMWLAIGIWEIIGLVHEVIAAILRRINHAGPIKEVTAWTLRKRREFDAAGKESKGGA